MMRRYVLMYAGWIAGVVAMSAIAVAWYRYVEEIGYREVANRLRSREAATDAPEATEDDTGFLTRLRSGE